ncbi:PAS domain-containing sensor histidine kinase [Pseudodesulfovibrio tunisiensis]|uniref:PAS domain-containing sensor histidine kinase n=1 Tax=Pseudodesulfovibrio tunisiensis TaxID=463192 RepID=UPI001FB3B762|nr:PAS domain-containing sensor histidine kinase [Pseudodesulfovibrio tunisiensis]
MVPFPYMLWGVFLAALILAAAMLSWQAAAVAALAGMLGHAIFRLRKCRRQLVEDHNHTLETSEATIRQVLDLLPDMVYARNAEGRILLVNQAMADSLGKTPRELTGMLYGDAHPDATHAQQEIEDDRSVIDTGIPKVALQQEYHDQQGNIRWLQTTKLPFVPLGTTENAALVLSVDITNRKLAEEKLRQLNEELELRVEERTRNLKQAKNELETSLDTLRRTQNELVMSEKMAALGGLVAGVAHEINTPLGVAVTAASYLDARLIRLQGLYAKSALTRTEMEEFLNAAEESTRSININLERAAQLVRSFKEVAADQSSEQPRIFNLKGYVDEVLVSLSPEYRRTGHVILNDCDDRDIYSYPGALMQIISNLLFNALTHAFDPDQQGEIRIGGTVDKGMLTLTFSDNGKGMPKEMLPRIFEPFFTTLRGNGGTGLGLHITFNTVTQTLNGTISCESTPGRGTTFTITAPMNTE